MSKGSNISAKWEELSPTIRKVVVVAGVSLLLVLLMTVFVEDEKVTKKKSNPKITNVISNINTRTLGLDAVTAKLKEQERLNNKLKKDQEASNIRLQQLQAQLESKAIKSEMSDQSKQEIDAIKEQLKGLNSQLTGININDIDGYVPPLSVDKSSEDKDENSEAESKTTSAQFEAERLQREAEARRLKALESRNANAYFADAPSPSSNADLNDEKSEYSKPKNGSEGTGIPKKIVRHFSKHTEAKKAKDKEGEFILPAGSILTGVLLNGMDAPTALGASGDPFPSTIRISKEAILPNRFTADVKECFLLVSGYGDMSSERAYLRGEVISCITQDEEVIEVKLPSYAVGEDGKAGIRGRLVSKQGAVIARSMMAGFLSGMAEMFDTNSTPTLNTNATGDALYTSNIGSGMIQGAASKGASTALEKVSDFYLDMAENLYPVIEIDAGRQIEIIVTKATKMTVK